MLYFLFKILWANNKKKEENLTVDKTRDFFLYLKNYPIFNTFFKSYKQNLSLNIHISEKK